MRPVVKIRHRIVQRSQIDAYLKRKGRSEEEVLAAADANQSNPEYIELEYTHNKNQSTDVHPQGPRPDVSPSALATSSCAARVSGSFINPSTRLPTPVSYDGTPSEQKCLTDWQSQREHPALNVEAFFEPPYNHSLRPPLAAKRVDQPSGSEASKMWSEIDNIGSYNNVISQMLRPDSPPASRRCQLNFFKLLSGAQRVSDQAKMLRDLDEHCGFSTDLTKDTNELHSGAELPQKFLSRFFGGCMLHTQGSAERAKDSFRHAGDILESMIRNCHPECLTALNIMLSVLEAHGQKDVAGEFLSTVLVFSQSTMNENPVAETTEFMVSVATRRVEQDIEVLNSIYERLKDRFGSESPSALVGLYHIAWRCAMAEEHRERALQTLTELIRSATEILGASHFLTITCMTTMARVLSYVRTEGESLSLMRQAIWSIDLRYASFHPYRLEVLHRLAMLLIEMHRERDAESILSGVVVDRAHVLGVHNDLTVRSLELFQEALASRGENVQMDQLASQLLSPSRINDVFEESPLTAYLPVDSITEAVAAGA